MSSMRCSLEIISFDCKNLKKITSLGGVSKFYSKEFLKCMHVDLSDFNDRKDITVCVEWNY